MSTIIILNCLPCQKQYAAKTKQRSQCINSY